MAKSMRSKREKRLRAIRREIVEPFYDNKDSAKLAAQEAALAAPKLPVRPPPNSTAAMDLTTTSTSKTDISSTASIFSVNAMGKPLSLSHISLASTYFDSTLFAP
ncbi:hypothetical protein F2P56_008947 [Juglans regia]|uniref:Uncharacterized protein n=1 Tax=Juglans regia TaxID=51240 RepID=A0A834CVU2_JUGRE|nr:hypothetical protein F2P56_008947 [Juglans regia]